MGDIVSSVTKVFTKFISWFIPMPEIPDFGNSAANQEAQGVLVNKQSNNANIPVIYGTRLVGGTRVFLETSGTDNQYLYGVLVLAEGEINGITSIKFDDDTVTFSGSIADGSTITSNDSRFGTNIQVQPFFGTDGQLASSLLTGLSSWGSNHKLSGIAYIAFRLEWDQDKFGGIPNIQAVVEGKKVVAYNSSSQAQTAAFSTNPAWCLLDYLTNTRYGKGIPIADIDIPSFYTASTIATTQIEPYSGGSNINLFDCNAVLDTSKKILDNVKILVKGMRGFLPYTQGQYKLIIETTGSAAITLTTDTIIGGLKVQSQRKNENFNRVSASFINPSANYQADTIVFPEADSDHQTLKTADGGFLQEGTIDLPTITSPYQALEFAEIVLNRSRNNLAVDLTANYEALDLAIGDIVNLTHPITGFSAKPFRVNGISLNSNFTVGLSLTEHQDSWYTYTAKSEVADIPNTTFPNPFVVIAPASVTLTDSLVEYNDGTVIVALDITIGASADQFVDYYQVEYKLSTDSDYIIYAQGSGLTHRVLNVIDQKIYDVRVKAVSTIGVSSSYTSAQRTIVGAIEPPSDVEDFSCNIVGQEAHLSWTQIPDLDLAYYNLRFSEEIDGTADWQNSVSLVEKVSRPATSITVPARQGTYLLKAVDKLGNFSSNATAIISNVISVTTFNNITTQAEHPAFAGTLTNTVVADDTLRLDSSELFDSGSGNFDSETTRFFDSGVANADFFALGDYLFSDVIDIGAKHTVRLTATLKQTSDNPDDLFDNRTGLFDVTASNFDGDTPANSNAHLEIATSDDNSTFTAFQNFVIGDYTARYFKFKVVLISRDLASTPVVQEVSIKIDMQDRIFSGNDITSGAGTKTVTFTNPFKTTNYAIGITAQGMATGDFFLLESKTINGFNVTFKNASNTAVSKTFDYIAKGF
jgi:hypothetical protein